VKEAPPKPKLSEKEVAAALSKMKKEIDEVEGITWYRAKTAPDTLSSNSLHFYFGQKGGSVWARFKLQYTGDDWLFFNDLVANCDGTKFNFTFKPETEVGYAGRVHEWVDVPMTIEYLGFLRAVADAKVATIRLSGKNFYRDRKIGPAEKKAITDAINAFQALGGNTDAFPWLTP
jgi:hypothetical protein